MARLPRFGLPVQPQHVIQRGNNRQRIFQVESDYSYYLETLHNAAEKYECDIHAYVLMTNYVHLFVTPNAENSLSKIMQLLGRYYVQHYNYRHGRTSTLWEGRYKATLIDAEVYLLTCMRYIELNPVRAKGMANPPSDYPWSSYRFNALGQTDRLITAHREYKRLGSTNDERQ